MAASGQNGRFWGMHLAASTARDKNLASQPSGKKENIGHVSH